MLCHALCKAQLALLCIVAVRTGIKVRMAFKQFNDAVTALVEEIAVMGNRNHGSLVFRQEISQPFNGIQIQMVGRLVQQQNVRILQNNTCQIHAGLFAAGQHIKRLRPHFLWNFQTVAYLIYFIIQCIAAHRFKFRLQRAVLLENLRVIIFLHLHFQLCHALAHLRDAMKRRAQNLLYGVARLINRNLVDDADRAIFGNRNCTGLIRQLAGNHAKQCGFSRAVWAYNCYFFSRKNIKRDVVQNLIFSKKLIQSFDTDVCQKF